MAAPVKRAVVPVICERCMHVWIDPGEYGITKTGVSTGKVNVTIRNSQAGVCKVCGGRGVVPDGEYTPFKSTLFDHDEYEFVIAALDAMLKATTSEPPREVSARYRPFVEYLKQLLPQNNEDACKTLTTAVGVVALLYSAFSDGVQVSLEVPLDVGLVLDAIVDALRTTQQNLPPASSNP
jgi:hypothetical protein